MLRKTNFASNPFYVWDAGCTCRLGNLFLVERINKFIFATSFWLEKNFYANSTSRWQLSLLRRIETVFPQNDNMDSEYQILWDAIDNAVIFQKLWSVIFSFLWSVLVLKKLLGAPFNNFYDLLLLMHGIPRQEQEWHSCRFCAYVKLWVACLKTCHPELFSILNTCRLQCLPKSLCSGIIRYRIWASNCIVSSIFVEESLGEGRMVMLC